MTRPADLERLLNDGYAQVLAMDAERVRLAARVRELAPRVHEEGVAAELRRRIADLNALEADIRTRRALLHRAEARGPETDAGAAA